MQTLRAQSPPRAAWPKHERVPAGVCLRVCACTYVQRGGAPLVVGGTGLYLKWFVYGKGKGPKASPEVEAQVKAAIQQVRLRTACGHT